MKMNLETLALAAAEFCGLKPNQAPGLAVLFVMIEREAFRDGHACSAYSDINEDYAKYVGLTKPPVQTASTSVGESSALPEEKEI